MMGKETASTLGSAPFAHDESSTAKLMSHYMIAMLPMMFMGGFLFSGSALILTGVCIISSMLWESLVCLLLKKPNTAGDLTAAVTGLLFAMTLPPTFPFYKAMLGTLIAVGILKPIFMQTGTDLLNSALAARLLMFFMFKGNFIYIEPFSKPSMNALADIQIPTPLEEWEGTYSDLFLGNVGGGIGEVCVLASILGLIYLLAMRVISLYAASAYVGTVFVFSAVTGNNGVFNILAGGIMLAGVFFVTDYKTTPLTPLGKVIFGVLAGVLTCVIRFYTNFSQDWVSAVLVINLLTPVIDRFTEKKPKFA